MSRRKWSLLIGLIGSVFAGVLRAAAGLDLWIER